MTLAINTVHCHNYIVKRDGGLRKDTNINLAKREGTKQRKAERFGVAKSTHILL